MFSGMEIGCIFSFPLHVVDVMEDSTCFLKMPWRSLKTNVASGKRMFNYPWKPQHDMFSGMEMIFSFSLPVVDPMEDSMCFLKMP